AALGRARVTASCVPIGEKLAARWMFHCEASPLPVARRDTSVPILRTCVPLFVVQDRLCSVHAADAIWLRQRRLCVINVKLTMRLVIAARPAWGGTHRIAPDYLQVTGTVGTQVASSSLVV